MSIDNIIQSSNEKVKAAFCLTIAEMVIDELKSNGDAYLIAKEGLDLSWNWIEKENVSGDTLAEYVDSDTEKDLAIRGTYYSNNKVIISTFVVLTIAIGMVARFAYDAEGNMNRPTPIWETTDELMYDIVEFASSTTLFDESKLNKIIEFLLTNYDHVDSDVIERQKISSLFLLTPDD